MGAYPARDEPGAVDIGGDVYYLFVYNEADEPTGAMIGHLTPDGEECLGQITFRGHGNGRPEWDVRSLDPLWVEPSILCSCGKHGWIRNGVWYDA
ncbi:hypothetical protein [Rhodococcus koreensis]